MDVKNIFKIINGQLTDEIYKCSSRTVFGELITESSINLESIYFYKKRIPISNPRTCPSSGARLLYGVVKSTNKFIPILIYGAYEEKYIYKINSKNIKLQKSGLIKIIQEKLNLLKK